jgi:tetratricopeptide (TPR) repeat protein
MIPVTRLTPSCALAFIVLAALSCAGGSSKIHTVGWIELTTENIQLQTDLPEDYARTFAEVYQRMRDAIAENEFPCALDQMHEPITVMVIDRHWRKIMGSGVSGVQGMNPVDLVDVDPFLVVRAEDEETNAPLFLHELTHWLVAICFPSAPLWLNEGLATFYETSKLDGDSLRIGFPNAMFVDGRSGYGYDSEGEVFELYSLKRAPSLETLRKLESPEFYEDSANYLASWVAVHLMQLGDRTLEKPFARYLAALHEGNDDETAWLKGFATIDMESRYRVHLTDRYVWAARPIVAAEPEVKSIRSMTRSEVALLLSQFYDWEDRTGAKLARAYLRLAHHQAPNAIEPIVYLGALAHARSKDDDAHEWFERALAIDPANPDALAAVLRWHTGRGAYQELEGREKQELEEQARALVREARTPFQLTVAADWYRAADDAALALRLANEAVALDSEYWPAHESAGMAAMRLERYDQAVTELTLALRLCGHASDDIKSRLQSQILALEQKLEPEPPTSADARESNTWD